MTEIFRHFRPTYFSKGRAAITYKEAGGISFLFKPAVEQSSYNYWIYVCPEDASFSSKAALKSLRGAEAKGVIPWGTITLSEDPLLDVAVKSLVSEEGDLPTVVSHQAFRTMIGNFTAQHLYNLYKKETSEITRNEYEIDSVR